MHKAFPLPVIKFPLAEELPTASEEEQDKVAQALKITKLKQRVKKKMHPNMEEIEKLDVDEDVTLVDMDTAVEMDVDIQGRMEEDVTTVKEINAAESKPTVFDDVEVTMTMAQTLIMIKAEKARILDEQLAKRMQDEEIE
nr:hypothetical protein [Tanacetum cinerariifolium]